MCGIVGIHGLDGQPVAETELRAMAEVIAHRGPDEDGFYVDGDVGLGMRRLSIIDLSTGRQPIRNEDGTVWVVLNGEIYNFRDQRRELEARGHRFYTGADTEVIVHLYEEYGADCVEHLRGMFAFAIWDTRRRSLLLARDRLGIKPLYYGVCDGRLVFASELKCFLTLPGIERRLDLVAVEHLLTFLSTPPDRSILEGIGKLEPGNVLTVSAGGAPATRRYWDLDFEVGGERSEADYVDELRAALEESVDLHMVADVPLGAFLSGGVDSSSVVATMARLSDRPVKTFAIGFGEAEFNELPHARTVAESLQTEHRELVLEPDVFSILDELTWYLDEPFGDSSAIPTYMVSRLAAEEVTVVLSGDGGDELFAGYDKYVVEGRERSSDGLPSFAKAALRAAARAIPEGGRGKNFLRRHGLSGVDRYLDATSFFKADQLERLFAPEVREALADSDPRAHQRSLLAAGHGDWLTTLQYNDIHAYLPSDILTKVDRMSMAHSIEARVPLLDHVFVETAAKIPSRLKLKDGRTKHVFKEALRRDLPEHIIDRRKQGFAIPLGHWFRGQLSSYVRDLLLSSTARQRGLFDGGYVEKLIAAHERGRDYDLHLWTMISLELWCRRFLDRDDVGVGASPAAAQATRVHEAAL